MVIKTPPLLKTETAHQQVELLEFELGRLRHEQQETGLQLKLARARHDELHRQLAEGALRSTPAIRENLQALELSLARYEQALVDLKQKVLDQLELVIAARNEADRAKRRSTAELERLLNQPTVPDTSPY